jgi:carboxymethylenebutenolidase
MQATLMLGGKSIRLDYYHPKNPNHHRQPAVLFIHGSGAGIDYWIERVIPLLAPAGVAVFALHYFDRTGTVRADLLSLTDGVHVPLWLETIRETIRHIAEHPAVDPDRIALVGVSLGAFLTLATATDPAVPPLRAVVGISGGLVPPYYNEATPAFPPTLILHGLIDNVVAVTHAQVLDEKLTSLGVPHEMHLFPGEGHWFSASAEQRLLPLVTDFLLSMFRKESS